MTSRPVDEAFEDIQTRRPSEHPVVSTGFSLAGTDRVRERDP